MVYKDNKRKTWYFRTYIIDKYGNKKQIERSGFKTKSEAKLEESNFLINKQIDDEDLTFQELYDIYIKSKKQKLKMQSLRATISRFELHILPYFKDYNIKNITNRVYLDWKEQILNKHYSYKYNSNLHGCMVSILNYAMDFYDLEKNIASKIGNFARGNYIPKVDFWTYEEFNQFINIVDDTLYSTLYNTLYFTGMRLGECLALNWNDFKGNYLDINKTIAKEHNNGNFVINAPKTMKSIRKIQLDTETIRILNELHEYYKKFVGFTDDWFIFGGLYPLSQSTVGRRKDEYCSKANVKKIRMHDFRHSHATLLLSRGIPVTVISKRLGHADMTMTLNTYSHLMPEDENKAINLINNLISQENFKGTEHESNKKSPINKGLINTWSGKQDLNLQPHGPKPRALPSCAISRYMARPIGVEPITF